jgi:hypothetical protein
MMMHRIIRGKRHPIVCIGGMIQVSIFGAIVLLCCIQQNVSSASFHPSLSTTTTTTTTIVGTCQSQSMSRVGCIYTIAPLYKQQQQQQFRCTTLNRNSFFKQTRDITRDSTSLHMFMGSDGGLLGIGGPEIVRWICT